jgi:hypothetical protein
MEPHSGPMNTPPRHVNHDGFHQLLLVTLVCFLIGAQVGLFLWKKFYYTSFQNVTLFGKSYSPPTLARTVDNTVFIFVVQNVNIFFKSNSIRFFRMLFFWTIL